MRRPSYLSIFSSFWISIKEALVMSYHLAKLVSHHPTCRFYKGVTVDHYSTLGRYNVLFKNVGVSHSVIGDHTFIQQDTMVSHAVIGKYCSIAMGVTIGPGQHPAEFISTHPAFYSASQPIVKTYCEEDDFVPYQKTQIGHDVWIGQGAIIMGGTTVGDGAIIGAHAVVTKDVPSFTVVGGVPAKHIKYRFDQEQRDLLQKLCWWDWTEEHLKQENRLFIDPTAFFDKLRSK